MGPSRQSALTFIALYRSSIISGSRPTTNGFRLFSRTAATAAGRKGNDAQPTPYSPGSLGSTLAITSLPMLDIGPAVVTGGFVRITFTSVIFSGGSPRVALAYA